MGPLHMTLAASRGFQETNTAAPRHNPSSTLPPALRLVLHAGASTILAGSHTPAWRGKHPPGQHSYASMEGQAPSGRQSYASMEGQAPSGQHSYASTDHVYMPASTLSQG